MVLVTSLRKAAVAMIGIALPSACDRQEPSTGLPLSTGGVVMASSAPTSSAAVPSAQAPIASVAVAAVSASAPPLAYPAVAKPATPPCADPRAVLAVRKSYDRSARLLVQQALVAHPELKVVADNAQARASSISTKPSTASRTSRQSIAATRCIAKRSSRAARI